MLPSLAVAVYTRPPTQEPNNRWPPLSCVMKSKAVLTLHVVLVLMRKRTTFYPTTPPHTPTSHQKCSA